MEMVDVFTTAQISKIPFNGSSASESFRKLGRLITAFSKSLPERKKQRSNPYLRASNFYNICPHQYVFDYWAGRCSEAYDMKSELRMGVGTYMHKVLQDDILGPLGILWGDWRNSDGTSIVSGYYPRTGQNYEYIEPDYFDLKARISGHSDGILSLSRLKHLTNNMSSIPTEFKKVADQMTSVDDNCDDSILLEIKTAGSYPYQQVREPEDLPPYYKAQAAIYQALSGIKATAFWYINRDTMATKVLIYEAPARVWEALRKRAIEIWTAIINKEIPKSAKKCKLPTCDRAKECPYRSECFCSGFNMEAFATSCISVDPSRRLFLESGVISHFSKGK